MNKPKITILDEVNIHIEGIPSTIYNVIKDELSCYANGFKETVAYQMGQWDGKRSFLEDGFTSIFFLPEITSVLERYKLQATFEDARTYEELYPSIDPDTITDQFLHAETGMTLREKQVDGIRSALTNGKGILEYATNTGKTKVCSGICKAVDDDMRVVIIVPNVSLAKKTGEEIEELGLDVKVIDAKVKPNKRAEAISNHRHIVITYKLFCDNAQLFNDNNWFLIIDEVHIFGDKLYEALKFDVPHIQYRIGMTGTFPSKRENNEKHWMICSTIGMDIIDTVSNHEMIGAGQSSKPSLYIIGTHHKEFMNEISDMPGYDWSIEKTYLTKNKERLDVIHKYIVSMEPRNTLVLGDASVVEYLASINGDDFVHQHIEASERDKRFDRFEESVKNGDGYILWASYGTSAVGISQNHIFRLILIDAGKSRSRILQSIGRGLRLDGVHDRVDVLDLYSKTPFSKKQKRERIKLYKQQKFEVTELPDIVV